MGKYSKSERFVIIYGSLLMTIPKVLSAWLITMIMVLGSIYLFRNDHPIWGVIVSLFTAWQFINFSIAMTLGLFQGLGNESIQLKNEEKPDNKQEHEEYLPEHAGFKIRLGAFFIDVMTLYLPRMVLLWLITQFCSSSNPLIPRTIADFILSWLYFAVLPASSLQGTIGMKILGIRVCTRNYERISFIRSAIRSVVLVGSAFLGCILVAFTNNKQGLHDLLTRTYVVG